MNNVGYNETIYYCLIDTFCGSPVIFEDRRQNPRSLDADVDVFQDEAEGVGEIHGDRHLLVDFL